MSTIEPSRTTAEKVRVFQVMTDPLNHALLLAEFF